MIHYCKKNVQMYWFACRISQVKIIAVPFYIDKAKEIEHLDLVQELNELMDICGHSRKYKNIIHLLNEVYESSEAEKQSRKED